MSGVAARGREFRICHTGTGLTAKAQSRSLARMTDSPPTVYRDRDFYAFVSARFLATVAMQVQSVAIGWQIYAITHSTFALGLVGLCQFGPMFLLTLPAGDISDRLDQRRILSTTQMLQGVCGGLFLLLALSHPVPTTSTRDSRPSGLPRMPATRNARWGNCPAWPGCDEGVYYPVDVEPYTPAVYFAKGKYDPQFRTKLKIALQLVERALEEGIPFRAMVADSFYGEDRTLRGGLRKLSVPYVMALKPSHAWWHPEQVAGTLQDVAHEAGWVSAEQPGKWRRITRTFRDGNQEDWWVLEIVAGPYGPDKTERSIVATTDPETLPDLSTWYLVTNLPAPTERLGSEPPFPPASLEEVIRLYGLRMWVEQSYKQVKHALGWSQYQVRSDKAIRRHWQLVWCAFSFCWYHASHPSASATQEAKAPSEPEAPLPSSVPAEAAGTGKKNQQGIRSAVTGILAQSAASSTRMVGALDHAAALLVWVVATAPASCIAVPPQGA